MGKQVKKTKGEAKGAIKAKRRHLGTGSPGEEVYEKYDGPEAGLGKTHVPIGRLQHTHRMTFDFGKNNILWWAFTCPWSDSRNKMKALAGGAYVDEPKGSKDLSWRQVTLHSTKIAIKDNNGNGPSWPENEIRIEVRRVATPKETMDLAAGKPVPPITVDVTFWATCID